MADLNLTGYKLTFDDEFNGNALDTSKWVMGDKWSNRSLVGNAEKQYYAGFPGDSYNPVSEANGVLDIRAQPAAASGMDTHGQPYTSGMVSTAGKFEFTYGYMEMRAQLPDGQGMWPTFWSIPADGSWPPEIDVVEKINNDPSVYQTTHTNAGQDGTKYNGINPSDGMHTYGVDWEPDSITYYVDGVKTAVKANVANAPEYILANMAVGGYWPGDPAGESADMKIDYVRVYSKDPNVAAVSGDGAGYAGSDGGKVSTGGSTGTGTPTPTPTPMPSTGKDTITVHASEDAYQGDAHFHLVVDGKSIGPEQVVTASHAAGQWQDIAVKVDLPAGAKNVGVVFDDDNWGGDAAHDRNVYVQSISVDGQAVAPDTVMLAKTGETASIAVPAAPAPTPTPTPGTGSGSGGNTVTVHVSEDAYQGDAQFKLLVDGQQVGDIATVTMSHSAGQWQDVSFHTDLANAKNVAVQFLNDAWGGSTATDRNMYVQSITIDGTAQTPDKTVLGMTGDTATVSAHPAPAPAPTPAPAGGNAIVLHMAEDAYQGDAKGHLVVDGKTVGDAFTVTASHGAGQWQDVTLNADLTGAKSVGVVFDNDAWGGSTATDRNLYVGSISIDGKAQIPATQGLTHTGDTASVSVSGTGTTPTPVPTQDKIVLHVAEDAFQGNAHLKLFADGKLIGESDVTADHKAGAWQDVSFSTQLAHTTQALTVQFTNDAWGGDVAHDRNLWVQSATIDGHALTPDQASLTHTGDTATFDVAHHPEVFA